MTELKDVVKNKDLLSQALRKPKEPDWYLHMKSGDNSRERKVGNITKCALSKEDKIQVGLDMIPMFQAKEEELTLKYEKIKSLKDELKSFKEGQGMVKPIRYV